MGSEKQIIDGNREEHDGSWQDRAGGSLLAVPRGLQKVELCGREWYEAAVAVPADNPEAFLMWVNASYRLPFGMGQFEVLKFLARESGMGKSRIALTQGQIADALGVSKSTVANTMRALQQPAEGFGGRPALTKMKEGGWLFDPWAFWHADDGRGSSAA